MVDGLGGGAVDGGDSSHSAPSRQSRVHGVEHRQGVRIVRRSRVPQGRSRLRAAGKRRRTEPPHSAGAIEKNLNAPRLARLLAAGEPPPPFAESQSCTATAGCAAAVPISCSRSRLRGRCQHQWCLWAPSCAFVWAPSFSGLAWCLGALRQCACDLRLRAQCLVVVRGATTEVLYALRHIISHLRCICVSFGSHQKSLTTYHEVAKRPQNHVVRVLYSW